MAFADLFPVLNLLYSWWLDTINTKQVAQRQLYECLSITKPLVVTGLGKHPTSALFSNLLHHHGCGHRSEGFSYISTIALPRICYFVNDEWVESSDTDDPPAERAFIVIGNLDPGYERYGERSVDLIELMDVAWTVTLLISEVVLGVLLHDPSLSRCQIIQQSWPLIDPESSCADKRLSRLYTRIEAVKECYQAVYRQKIKQQVHPTRNASNDIMSTAACARMAEYGVAEGPPRSDTRMRQARSLWGKNYPAMHIHISRGDKERWLDWANALKEGTSFLASAMRRVGLDKHHPLLNCLQQHIPSGAGCSIADRVSCSCECYTGSDWLEDEANLTTACLSWGAAMKLHLAHDHFSSTNQKRRIAIRWQSDDTTLYAYMPVNHKRIVTLSATHPLLIRWKDGDDDVNVLIRFKAKSHAQVDTRQHYRITFEKSGIYLHKDHDQQPTFHFTIEDIDADPAVRRLWKHEMLEQGFVIDGADQHESMRSVGLPAFTAVIKANNRPKVINPNDALWLLKEFIDKQSPQHLNFHLAPPDLGSLVTGYDSFQQSFADFLHSNHQQHPYNQWWLAKIADESMKKEAKNITANLLHLYPKSIKDNFHTFKKRYSNDHSNKKQCITIIIKQ